MGLSAFEISLVAAAWRGELIGAVIRAVRSSAAPDRVVLELRSQGENHLAQIVVSATGARLGRLAKEPARAQTPHPFVMLLRREATGMALHAVEQIHGDRVVTLALSSQRKAGRLVCELTGRHGNLFWIGSDGLIVGSFHPNRSSRRRLVPGEPYVPPAPRPVPVGGGSRFEPTADLESRIEAFFDTAEEKGDLESRRAAVTRAIRMGLKRLVRLRAGLEADKARSREASALQAQADLLAANLGKVEKGARAVELIDFEGRPVTVPLDPAASPTVNMTRLFERAKRLRRAAGPIDDRAGRTARDLERFEELLSRAASADRPEALDDIASTVSRRYPDLLERARPGKTRQTSRSPFREYVIADGRVARVGRSAADNDALTLHHCGHDDLWLHARGARGSHVVVPLGRGEEPSAQVLVDAAHLAARFSQARAAGTVEVTYTRRRYVQKPRGAPPGSVRLLREKTLLLEVDEDRLFRLLRGAAGISDATGEDDVEGGPTA